jgi:hypothetical protein
VSYSILRENYHSLLTVEGTDEIITSTSQSFWDHTALAVGILLAALEGVWYLLLQSLGWGLRNRQLVRWVFGRCFCVVIGCCNAMGEVVGLFGWSILGGVMISYAQRRYNG